MKLFLAPHNDDETLFGAYTILNEKPLVVVITDSYVQFERGDRITAKDRIGETKEAMGILDAKVEFLGIRDTELNEKALRKALEAYNPEIVFAPAIEGGNLLHDLVGKIADELFGYKVIHYSTYTKDRSFPAGKTRVAYSDLMKRLKLKALKCYWSQINLPSVKIYFENMKTKDEYYT